LSGKKGVSEWNDKINKNIQWSHSSGPDIDVDAIADVDTGNL
jgi:hypothetical protein